MRKLLALFILLLTMPAYAFNLGFLEYTPTYYFTKSDWNIMQSTVNRALDTGRSNQRYSWKNPDSTAFGYVMPFDTTHSNGQLCRQLTIYNNAKSVSGEATYRFCKINGEWKTI